MKDTVAATKDRELRAVEKKQPSDNKNEERLLALKPKYFAGDLVRKIAADEIKKITGSNGFEEPAADADAVDADPDVIAEPEKSMRTRRRLSNHCSRSRPGPSSELARKQLGGDKATGQRSSSALQQKSQSAQQRRGRSRSRGRTDDSAPRLGSRGRRPSKQRGKGKGADKHGAAPQQLAAGDHQPSSALKPPKNGEAQPQGRGAMVAGKRGSSTTSTSSRRLHIDGQQALASSNPDGSATFHP